MNIRFITTTKCCAFQHPEFLLKFDAAIPKGDIDVLTTFLEESVENGTLYNEGDLITLGSMLFRVARFDNSLTLEEPDLQSMPIKWRQGVTRSVQLLRLQKDIAESVSLDDEIDPPSIRCSLLVGSDLMLEDEEFVLDRIKPGDSDSGWFVGRRDTVLNYDVEASLRRIAVYQAIMNWPRIAGFLGLPAGCQVEICGNRSKISRNGSTIEIKTGSFMDVLSKILERNGGR
jgi:hypothetical protein